jgi:group I intron endonuclease
MAQCICYYLTDSSGLVRYIGQTTRKLTKRLYEHKYSAKNRTSRHPVADWIKKHDYEVFILPMCYGIWNETEIDLIKSARDKGYNLLNVTEGGGGVLGNTFNLGRKLSEETKQKIRESVRKQIPLLRAQMLGYKHSEETKQKMRKPHKVSHTVRAAHRKINLQKAEQIITRCSNGEDRHQIAVEFGIHYSSVIRILTMKDWRKFYE